MMEKIKKDIMCSAGDNVFGKDVTLLERNGTEEKTVSLYIKFNKLENCFVIVISFHEQKHPLTYYFK